MATEAVLEFSVSSVRPTLKRVLECLGGERLPSGLTSDICAQLLLEEGTEAELEGGGEEVQTSGGLRYVTGYPAVPLYVRLADCMSYWSVTGSCPVFELPVMFMLNEEATLDKRKGKLEPVGVKLKSLYKSRKVWSEEEQFHTLLDILKYISISGFPPAIRGVLRIVQRVEEELDLRGVLDLLGLRCTAGSCETLPPQRSTLLASFNKQHHPSARLSVGGRALSKHCHRDDSLQWWGSCTGTEAAKNEHALKVALKILNSATWINIHMLLHDVQVLEVRHEEGYGLRWLSDGSEFRGFLEPQMKDGHAVGWRH